MDDSLLAEFQSTFSVSDNFLDKWSPHPHPSLYKQKREGYGSQGARRTKLLEEQKTRRRNYADYARRVVAGETWEEDGEDMEEEGLDEVDAGNQVDLSNFIQAGTQAACHNLCVGIEFACLFFLLQVASKPSKKRIVHPYRNQIMLSEWMVEVPDDLQDNWVFVVCPVGQRSLVVASRGTTTAYNRGGRFLKNFPSLLPGGSRKTYHTAHDNCILDCIYHHASGTYFVVDVMCWRGHPVYDSDTNFRFYWLRTKISEEGDGLSTHSRFNPYVFLPMDSYPGTSSSLTEVLGTKWPLEVDGLLFFHKEAHYTPGHSPLTLWLKPRMVTDVLGVPVSQEFLDCTPVMSSEGAKMDTGSVGGSRGRKGDGEKKKTPQEQTESMESTATTAS